MKGYEEEEEEEEEEDGETKTTTTVEKHGSHLLLDIPVPVAGISSSVLGQDSRDVVIYTCILASKLLAERMQEEDKRLQFPNIAAIQYLQNVCTLKNTLPGDEVFETLFVEPVGHPPKAMVVF
ncbi:hypothetical protein HGM15179_010684 [Zosterops borbonicus]|uniref:Uncharacterized protein n=1 Tax=Zosterops borbonicus TaxID=364589 RepID=A0A8K1GE56_9PASS|nr:hypothetical protein HGM15179_010684 [Zosterops borbonicus]